MLENTFVLQPLAKHIKRMATHDCNQVSEMADMDTDVNTHTLHTFDHPQLWIVTINKYGL